MKVVIISCVYPPEPMVSARTSAELAVALEEAGDEATVIAPFPNRPAGTLYPGFRRRWRTRSGNVIRTFTTLSRKSTLASRLLENVTFGISAALTLLTMKRPDVVYLNTWPLFATGFAAVVARLRGIPFIISVQDVYPESLSVQGRIDTRSPVARLLRSVDGWIARSAAAVVVLTERWGATYRTSRGVSSERVHVVPNWIDETEAAAAAGSWRDPQEVSAETFLAVYGGNVGAAAGVEELIAAFAGTERAELLIAGEGSSLDACRSLARELAPDSVRFHSPWPVEETMPVLRSADLLILPTKGRQSAVSVPSKLLSYLLAERPVLAVADPDSEVANVLRDSCGGWVVVPEDARAFRDAFEKIRAMSREERLAAGRRGRRYALDVFGRERCLARLLAIVRGAA